MTQRLVLVLIWGLCLLASALAALRMLWAVIASPRRAWRLAVAHDQLFNATANGDEDETLSSRAAKAQRAGRRWGCMLCGLLDRIDPGHCDRSVEPDEGHRWR